MQVSLGARHSFLRQHGVPEGWCACELRELADVVGGATPSRGEGRFWSGGDIPWATPTDLTANHSKFITETAERITLAGLEECAARLLPAGSILYTSRATIGAKAIAGVPMATNQGFASFVLRSVDGDYLYYLLDLLTPIIKRLGAGTTFDEVSKRDVKRVWCSVPELPEEQAAIARILDAVDTALERTRDAIARARVLQSSVLAEAFDALDTPKEKLGDYAAEVRYGTSQAAHERGWGSPTLRIPNVVGDELNLRDVLYVDLRPIEVERLALEDGDLLLVRTNGNPNYVGRSAVFRQPDDRTWVYASYLIRLRLKTTLIPDFVNVYLGIEQGRRELLRRVTTSAGNHNINGNSIRLIPIPIPKKKREQERIIEIAAACRSHQQALNSKLEAQANLKCSLMHDLLTGRVRTTALIESKLKEASVA